MEFKGNCIGVRLEERGPNDPHICFTLMVENDENWFDKMSVSSYWLDETIAVLQVAKDAIERRGEPDIDEKTGGTYGYKFKNN